MVSSGSQGGPDLGQSLRSAALLGAGIASWADGSSGSPAEEPQGGTVGRVCSGTWLPPPLTVTGKFAWKSWAEHVRVTCDKAMRWVFKGLPWPCSSGPTEPGRRPSRKAQLPLRPTSRLCGHEGLLVTASWLPSKPHLPVCAFRDRPGKKKRVIPHSPA